MDMYGSHHVDQMAAAEGRRAATERLVRRWQTKGMEERELGLMLQATAPAAAEISFARARACFKKALKWRAEEEK